MSVTSSYEKTRHMELACLEVTDSTWPWHGTQFMLLIYLTNSHRVSKRYVWQLIPPRLSVSSHCSNKSHPKKTLNFLRCYWIHMYKKQYFVVLFLGVKLFRDIFCLFWGLCDISLSIARLCVNSTCPNLICCHDNIFFLSLKSKCEMLSRHCKHLDF